MKRLTGTRTIVVMILATIFGLVVTFPIYYMVAGSFFSIREFSSFPPTIVPSTIRLLNIQRAINESTLIRFMLNSLISASVGAILRIAIATLSAFAFVYKEFKAKKLLFIVILATMLLPADALILENYILISRLGLIDTYLGIISIHLLAPVQMFMLRQIFKSIPITYREAASIDGCGDVRFLIRIATPMSRSIMLIFLLQSFVTIWNSYLWPLLVTNDTTMRTVQVGITLLSYAENLDFGPVFAAISLVVLPSILLFLVFRKRIVEGVVSGSLG